MSNKKTFNDAPLKGNLLPPKICNICESNKITLETNDVIYNGVQYGNYPFIYLCNDCRSYVGIHPNSNSPLGTLANNEMRQARKRVKFKFIEWYMSKGFSRNKAYSILAKELNIPKEECHFGWFDVKKCNDAEKIILGFL